jgi:predicted dehydrogenase
MIKPVKIAILSCNHGHAPGYYPLKNDPMFELVAASVVPEAHADVRIKNLEGIPQYQSDIELFDAHPELEAVIIASDNASHFTQVCEAAKRGLHIFSMKVPTFHMEQYDEMIRVTEEAGVVCQVELEMRHHAPVYRIKEAIETGKIGKLLSINAVNYSHNPVWWRPWQANPEASYGSRVSLRDGDDRFRGGALADHPHLFDIIRYITGSEFSQVYADISPNIREGVETEDMIRVIGQLENGVNYSIDPSYANNEEHVSMMVGSEWNKYPRCVEVFMTAVGTEGVIVADLYGKTYCHQLKSNGKYIVSGLGSAGLWNRRMEEFYHCIRSGRKPTVDLRSHYNSIVAMNAAYDSVATGEIVHL